MFCKKCGRELKEGAAFCAYCGATTEQKKTAATGMNPMPTNFMPYSVNKIPGIGAQTGVSSGSGNVENQNKNRIAIIGAAAVALLLVVGVGIGSLVSKGGNGSKASGDKASREKTEETTKTAEETAAGTEDLVRIWEGECGFPYFFWQMEEDGTSYDEFLSQIETTANGEDDIGIMMNSILSAKAPAILELEKKGTWKLYIEEEGFYDASANIYYEIETAAEEAAPVEGVELWNDLKSAPEAERGKVLKEGMSEADQKEADKFFNTMTWSGSYEVNEEDGEITLTVETASGEKQEGTVLLGYEMQDGKLSLEVLEDQNEITEPWKDFGLFDKRLSAK